MKIINIKNIFNIVKKELKSYFDNPTAYVVIIVFLLLLEFLFFKSVFLVNLSPRILRGIESKGMILAAGSREENQFVLLELSEDVETGSKVS